MGAGMVGAEERQVLRPLQEDCFFLIISQSGKKSDKGMPHLPLYMHERACLCLCVSLWWQERHLCDGNLGREVHEWPVFAHVRMSVLVFFFTFLVFISQCWS